VLTELRIRNVAVIDQVALALAPGLNVLTGETGAGKSLIVGALELLLGDRAASDRVRAGSDKGTVEGVFELGTCGEALAAVLDARGLEAVDGVLVLRRELSASGRSRAWVNGTPVTAAVLAEVGGHLVAVHGQHEARELVDPAAQRALLDAFAESEAVRARVARAVVRRRACVARLAALQAEAEAAGARVTEWRALVREVDELRLRPGDDERLDADIRRLAHAEELQGAVQQAVAALAADERGALARLGVVRRLLAQVARIDDEAGRWEPVLEGARLALDELARELEGYAEGVEADPSRLRALEARRETLMALLRRHGPSLEELLAAAEDARAALARTGREGTALADAARAVDEAEGEVREAAAALTARRTAAAGRLGDAASALLGDLGMSGARLAVRLMPLPEVGEEGAESVVLVANLNQGAEERPLARIASGGELSRVMLALSTVLAHRQQVPTLVFDEVDAGIGGAVAWQVGALLRRVAGHHQVLSISHLAQIAARAHHHVVVRKGAVGAVTTADTVAVEGEARVQEVARMLGGDADREVSRAHARELLARGEADGDDGASVR
jgi:DNA repair protein RecN (Recombination protein N)